MPPHFEGFLFGEDLLKPRAKVAASLCCLAGIVAFTSLCPPDLLCPILPHIQWHWTGPCSKPRICQCAANIKPCGERYHRAARVSGSPSAPLFSSHMRTGSARWPLCTSHCRARYELALQTSLLLCVCVFHLLQGFFGKGFFSKSEPTFDKSKFSAELRMGSHTRCSCW